ncbi:thiolase C-terminal domain-containing protein [Actinocorallia sp. A-T 12471]|uniref:thiolase C-terminal domain-containing protein n=1 Tax=Actinocorallia sp. A-T 12471 TaxID=3089813 RepID=UPI0029D38989|nr:beta-ketoacyl synthase N-terminal-like domain-containing protein [Actinocorallia sp. A-T 12471]MDX6743158.1 beta-ketoacyl synthase N-terminal-like domain-containing protein [Actinocorallia sp. A-T 12471]
MAGRAFVVGVGMTKFEKPGSKDWEYPDMAKEAVGKALEDAGLSYEQIEQAYAGSAYGSMGQRALYEVGMTGLPVMTVSNACATGSSALFLARNAVRGGLADCVLAFGMEKMEKGSLGAGMGSSKVTIVDHHLRAMVEGRGGWEAAAPMPQMFGNAGREHMERYGSTPEHYAWIGWKNHKHSVNNPYAQFQDEYTLDQVKDAPMIFNPLTKLQCSPTSDGAAAAIVVSERFLTEHDLWDQAVEIAGQHIATDTVDSFAEKSSIQAVGFGCSQRAAAKAMDEAGITIEDVDVIELHDCFSANELISYEALGMAPVGEAHKLVEAEATTYGGRWVVNPSGGLISKGHPLGATGIAQCAELTWQLRGQAGARQVEGARVALQHNIGLGSACAVAVYRPAR